MHAGQVASLSQKEDLSYSFTSMTDLESPVTLTCMSLTVDEAAVCGEAERTCKGQWIQTQDLVTVRLQGVERFTKKKLFSLFKSVSLNLCQVHK